MKKRNNATNHQKLLRYAEYQEHGYNHCISQHQQALEYNMEEWQVDMFWTHHLKLGKVVPQDEGSAHKKSVFLKKQWDNMLQSSTKYWLFLVRDFMQECTHTHTHTNSSGGKENISCLQVL